MASLAIQDETARPWKRAMAWLALLGPLFFATYGFANWLASQHSNVGAIVFEWERHIPFWAWSIVPYWSIDIFYAVSLFVCATRRELDTHARRLLAAQMVAVACFILFPLQQTSVRPPTDGIFGLMFDALAGFDKPFNQAPALHITLLIILWALYARHVHGVWRWLLHLWFTLIGVSVLTTYQHHFIDVPTGLLAGWFCVWLFPDDRASPLAEIALTADAQRRALARRYGAGAMVIALLAAALGGWALWLWWIVASLAIVCSIYLILNETSFQKHHHGKLSPASLWLLAPYLVAAWANSRWWTRKAPAPSRITNELWLGRAPAANELPLGVKTLIDFSAELPRRAHGTQYVNLPVLDLTTLDATRLAQAVQAIERALCAGPVLAVCALGYSRSAAAVAAWLIASGRAPDAAGAAANILQARPHAVLKPAQLAALEQFAREHRIR